VPLRIISYNVRYFGHGMKGVGTTAASMKRIAAALAALQPLPDVVCLQEVETQSLRAGWALKDKQEDETQLQTFMRLLAATFSQHHRRMPYAATYFPAHAYGAGRFKLYTTGLAVLVNTAHLSVLGENSQAPGDITHYGAKLFKLTKQKRILAHLALEDSANRRFHVFNTHLSLPSPANREFWRQKVRFGFGPNQLEEARAVVRQVEERSGKEPALLVGDFNSAPASPVYQLFTDGAGLAGAQETLEQIDATDPRGFATAGFMRYRMHLDHLFGRGVEWLDVKDTAPFGDRDGLFHGLSDHVPLLGTLELERQ
jgi:endonuclease/exonuclease/phosphatase family metal-dependent hydrolase